MLGVGKNVVNAQSDIVFRLQIWKEEKELVERFGEGFIEYQKNVPALFIRPSKIRSYFKFLRMGL